jgi:hypothetical protein
MPLDIDQLVQDIKNTVSEIINKDVTTVRGFSNRQLTGIANQTALVATGIASGEFTGELRDFFLDQLVELARNFANTLVGLLLATIERIWNAIVNVVYSAISKFTGVPLPSFNPQ